MPRPPANPGSKPISAHKHKDKRANIPTEELRDFVRRLAWSLPLRKPSPVDSPRLRRLLIERTGGVTLGICKAFERAAVAAIRGGAESIAFESFKDPEIWRGVAAPTRGTFTRPRPKRSPENA